MLSSASKLEGPWCTLEGKHFLEKFHSGMHCSSVGMSLITVNQEYMLNEVSLNRNTCKPRLCISHLMKICDERLDGK